MKARQVTLLILLVILVDQALKFYIKLNYHAGEAHNVLGNWFRLHFVENEGMAWGWKFGGGFGKIILTLFRLVAVIWGSFLLRDFIRKKYHKGFIICAALIYAGALGNLIDSLFYGLIFEESIPYSGQVAHLFPKGGGYASLFHGKVVDMLYFPIIENKHYPSWVPFVGGDEFTFFSPVFNIADASISIGVIVILFFQNKFFKKNTETQHHTVETTSVVDDKTQIF
ncbi:lipoprotein signal peptidase [Sediminibacterium roseum]|uniref:Lipoprotein signal peptidase n=1 Tax=Sediminibacterium roseum TaxID=1978412 RepID=A0ABW9ZWS3_9BACT|nr:lipoprotein signal peptidase [Sediminibacterium roseum]NCI51596.1 lipoprotein signal peptidase [Sediminibacterium roseum]